jgi:hypothetical protein
MEEKDKVVLSLFDFTGNMVRPWAEAGYRCICVDIKHEGIHREGKITYYGKNILGWLPPLATYKMVFAFPPCTHTAVSGARWFKVKGLTKLIESLQLFNEAIKIGEWAKCAYMIENPVSTVSTYYRLPDYIYDPFEYGGYKGGENDTFTKKTCLWVGNGFIMPTIKPIDPIEGSRMHFIPPGEKRAEIRSTTTCGFASAVFEANNGKKL